MRIPQIRTHEQARLVASLIVASAYAFGHYQTKKLEREIREGNEKMHRDQQMLRRRLTRDNVHVITSL